MTQEQALELFKQSGAFLEGHFLLTSGRHSKNYMQCAKLFCDSEISEKLCAVLAEKYKDEKIDLVIGPAVGAIIMCYEMSRQLKVKNIFAERENGKMTLRRGFSLDEGTKVLIVEDVVTTGGSVKEVIALCEEAKANIVGIGSIVDRSAGKVDFGYPYKSVLSLEVPSYEADECPLCKEGKIEVVKPGSRKLV